MRRVIYAPKVFIYIRSSQQNGKIYDVSDDVVSGSVKRNVNALSTAEFTLRNRFRKWIKDPSNQESIFLPMDMVSIWLQRDAGSPVQVFTGYLDEVPYFQLYPGNATFRASCTLKRLGVQWFDPGLEFYTNMVRNLGWNDDPTTGQATNYGLMTVDPGQNKPVNDGGYAELLHTFMTHIAGWRAENILISDLPSDIPKEAASLYNQVNTAVEGDLSKLEQAMQSIMGVAFNPVNGINADGSLQKLNENLVKQVKQKADQYNISLLVPVVAGLITTGFTTTYSHGFEEGPLYGYGMYAMRPSKPPPTRGPGAANITIGGHKVSELSNPSLATELFCRALIQVDDQNRSAKTNKFSTRANQGDTAVVKAWIEAALKRKFTQAEFNQALAVGKSWVKAWSQGGGTNQQAAVVSIKKLDWTSPDVLNLMTTPEKTTFQHAYKNKVNAELAPYYYYIKKSFGYLKPSLVAVKDMQAQQLYIEISSPGSNVKANAGSQKGKSVGSNTQTVYNALARHVGDPNIAYVSTNRIRLDIVKGTAYPTWANGQQVVANSNDTSNPEPTSDIAKNGLTLPQLGQFSLDSAFTAQYQFPTNYIASHILTGEKALMNDIPCLDGVTQFTQASMRNYMSLPDGRFLAFYPDYFGNHGRKPYTWIEDIEVIDMKIQLTDDALATHVYVIGDTFGGPGDNTVDEFDMMASRGVVTIDLATLVDSLIVPVGDRKFGSKAKESHWGRLQDAAAFLQHYGARVYKEEAPLIRNSFFEFLLAWQRWQQKWSAQFSTEVEFTFRPDILAGGIIGFTAHNLQMYVEDVTHNFDYTNGFTTTATLSSPAAVDDNGTGVAGLPGFALAGTINSVGNGGD